MISEYYEFEVPGKPVAKARPRKSRKDGISRIYTPQESLNFEQLVGFLFKSKYKSHIPTKNPVKIKINSFFQLPKGVSQKKQNTVMRDFMVVNDSPYPRAKKPDTDNLIKAVLDGLNQIAFYDDAQVFEITAGKYYAEKTSTVIEIRVYDTEVI